MSDGVFSSGGEQTPGTVPQTQVTINPGDDFTKIIIRQTEVDVIVISDDKLHIILTNCLSKISTLNQWATPLGILVTLVITMLTTTFKTFILKDSVWEAIFWLLIVTNVIWLLKSIPYKHMWISFLHSIGKCENVKSISDVHHVIDKIKQGDTKI